MNQLSPGAMQQLGGASPAPQGQPQINVQGLLQAISQLFTPEVMKALGLGQIQGAPEAPAEDPMQLAQATPLRAGMDAQKAADAVVRGQGAAQQQQTAPPAAAPTQFFTPGQAVKPKMTREEWERAHPRPPTATSGTRG